MTLSASGHSVINDKIKELKENCITSYNILCNNLPLELQEITQNNSEEKSLCYIDGLRANLQSSETPILNDNKVLTSQMIGDLDQNISQIEQLVAYKKGLVFDVDNEIERLKTQINIVKEALEAGPKNNQMEVKPEHVKKAKHKFQVIKTELHSLIHSLFPNIADDIIDVLAILMQERMNEDSSGYVKLTADKLDLIEFLIDTGVVTFHPYDKSEVKLAY